MKAILISILILFTQVFGQGYEIPVKKSDNTILYKIENRYNLEMELIESKSKNDISWFGEVGFQNKVRLDGVLTNNNNRVIENKDKSIKIIRK